jgi:anaerobic ribonucleoside-triphosphate reductase
MQRAAAIVAHRWTHMVYSRHHINRSSSTKRRRICRRHRWRVNSFSAENFSTIERCTECGAQRERELRQSDGRLLEEAREEKRREETEAKLKRELKFEKSKGLLNADYQRMKEISEELAKIQQKPEVSLPGVYFVLLIAMAILFIVL